MDELGFSSSYLTANLGTMFLLIFITTAGLAMSFLLIPLAYFITKINNIKNWLDEKFKWNWTIRLLLEGLLEVSFCSVLTISYVNKDSFGGYFNLIFAYILFVSMVLLPIFIAVFYQYKFNRMREPEDTEFHDKYGAPYEGLCTDKRWSIFFPFMVCMRRISYMIVVLNFHSSAYT